MQDLHDDTFEAEAILFGINIISGVNGRMA